MDRHSSRRDLLLGFFDAFRPARPGRPDPATALRPPGALDPDEAFMEACSGCGDCVDVCPAECIFMMKVSEDRQIPAIAPSAKPCTMCESLACITACPDEALVSPGPPERVRIGIAKVDPRNCITFKGQQCDRCYRACPFPDRAMMVIGGRPLVGSGSCTGCGLCENACPETPKAITVIAERLLIPGMRVPKDEYQTG
jgi:ferredoxin-type protein NapG